LYPLYAANRFLVYISVDNTPYTSPAVLKRGEFKLIIYGYDPPVTDASQPNKQIYQRCSATIYI